MTGVQRVLVVGGGIGGLCTAIALRGRGIDVDVVERNPDWDVYGVGIIQPGNAIRALNDLGLARRAVAEGFPIAGVRVCTTDGHELVTIPNPPLVEGLPGMNGITRPRLHQILQTSTLDASAAVRTGVTVESLHDDGAHVTVTCTDGQTGVYDLVVGADGIHSQIRDTVFGEDIRPEFTGQVCWRYNLPRPPEVDHLTMFNGAVGKAGLVPLAQDLMYMLCIEKVPDGSDVHLPREGLASLMRERVSIYGGLIGDLREQITDDDAVVYRPVEVLLMPLPWHRGRVLLIGDAAHATSPHAGQGAAQAIEDAVVVADELTKDQSISEALEAHEQRRYPRCELVVESSRQIGEHEMAGRPDADPTLPGRIAMAVAAPL
jgi:2-polyprenyl-6-methoxyphenol hydroxylase-like FAD-dependent oxidoreductase